MRVRLRDKRRFVVVSAACAALHNAVMIGGEFAGVHYLASCLLSYVVVVTVGYALHAAYTFGQPASIGAALRYAAAMAANYPASVVLIFLLYGLAALPMPVAAPLATALMLAWNYAASRWAILSRPLEASG